MFIFLLKGLVQSFILCQSLQYSCVTLDDLHKVKYGKESENVRNKIKPRHEKTHNKVFKQVRQKKACTVIEKRQKLEILDLGRIWILTHLAYIANGKKRVILCNNFTGRISVTLLCGICDVSYPTKQR